MSIVTGHEFMKLADLCVVSEDIDNKIKHGIRRFDRVGHKRLSLPEDLRSVEIICVAPENIRRLSQLLRRDYLVDLIIVTHNSDMSIDARFLPYLNHPKVKKWFGQNVQIRHPKLHAIPIGMANPQYTHGNKQLLHAVAKSNWDKSNLVFVNFSIGTNPHKREPILELFKNKYPTHQGQNQTEYWESMAKSKFCISPPGNGVDCHRIWECIYLKTIPIVEKNIAFDQFTDLPILFIEDWHVVNDNFLNDVYLAFSKKEWNYEKAYMEYWRREITGGK